MLREIEFSNHLENLQTEFDRTRRALFTISLQQRIVLQVPCQDVATPSRGRRKWTSQCRLCPRRKSRVLPYRSNVKEPRANIDN